MRESMFTFVEVHRYKCENYVWSAYIKAPGAYASTRPGAEGMLGMFTLLRMLGVI